MHAVTWRRPQVHGQIAAGPDGTVVASSEDMALLIQAAHVAVADFVGRGTPGRARTLYKRVMCRLMGGHWPVLHATRTRLALRCVACGHTSPGWDVRAAR